MKTFKELREHIQSNNLFDLEQVGTFEEILIYFSAGIAETYSDMEASDIQSALTKFISGDYGSFYGSGENATAGNEYGEYKSKYGDSADTGAIMLHREAGTIKIYFQFER